ncbi:hypothetical protein [Flammeovirga kamogawensis]|nr:hypothetical protein [Flammeovirga kamogawensis]MBB6462575.1 hypothetical protein [Flammeovirga kamogawensis]
MENNTTKTSDFEIKYENGKVVIYQNNQYVKTFHSKLMALGFINRNGFKF